MNLDPTLKQAGSSVANSQQDAENDVQGEEATAAGLSLIIYAPTSRGRAHYKKMGNVCTSVCLSVACLD